jgi:hypothetical protein
VDLKSLWRKFNKKHFNGSLITMPSLRFKAIKEETLLEGLMYLWTAGFFEAKREKLGRIRLKITVNPNQSKKKICETVLHEMIHQLVWQEGLLQAEQHGSNFQKVHVRILGKKYGSGLVVRRRS